MNIVLVTKKPHTQIVRVTPTLARDWLERVPEKQRDVQEPKVKALATTIVEGRFVNCAGNTIVFDRNGDLIDGQYRCQAIVAANRPVTSFVCTGVPPEAIHVLDHDLTRRTIGDSIKIMGEKNGKALAGAIRVIWRVKNRCVNRPKIIGPDTTQSLAWLVAHQNIGECLSYGRQARGQLGQATGTGMYYLFRERDAGLAERFFKCMGEGTGLSRTDETSGLLLLREKIYDIRKRHGISMDGVTKLAMLIKAWNAMRAGKVIRSLRWSKGEPFPEIE